MPQIKIEMHPVTSSAVKAIGYSLFTRTCRIEFTKGDIYDYDKVPKSSYDELIHAPSIGKALRNFTATFKGVKVGVEKEGESETATDKPSTGA